MTPYELNIRVEMYSELKKEQRKADIVTAFYSAYFQRLKTLSSKDLNDILDKIDNPEMDDYAMFGVIKRLDAMFGGEV